ncbi:MAG: toxin-antitoxin system YwqK family antitoxin, partial [Bacteroidia bacterium]
EYTFNYKNGKLHGYQSAEDDYSQKQYVLNFNNGINHGPQIYSMNNYENQFDSYNGSKAHINYDSGRIDGYVILLKNYSMPRLVTIYNKGKINGIYTTFNTDELVPKPSLEAHFTNDTLQGDVVIYSLGFEKSRTPFINGDATGIYTSNHVQLINEELSDSVHFNKSYIKFYPELKLKLKNGELRDTAFAYFENGAIKYIAIADTLIHHKLIYQDEKSIRKEPYRQIMDSAAAAPAAYTDLILKGDYDEEEIATEVTEVYRGNQIYFGLGEQYGANEMEIDPVFDMPKAHFTFYYKSGLKSQEGRMSSNEKYGVWKYWNENGVLMKEIEYKAGVDSSTMQTVWYRGKITGYYPSGKKMMEGLILDEELSYQCSQEVEIAYEDVYYLNFLSETGDSLLKKQTGPVTDYHLNGHKHFMGQVTYGNRTGLWRFYDPDGNLKAIGEYADGYKQGKWLEGDLGGINFLDNACSINEALSLIQEKRLHDIDVTETIYEMGREVSSSHLVLEKF